MRAVIPTIYFELFTLFCFIGSLTFTHAIKLFEKDDEEIAKMAENLKSRFIPLLPRPPLFVPRDVTWSFLPDLIFLHFLMYNCHIELMSEYFYKVNYTINVRCICKCTSLCISYFRLQNLDVVNSFENFSCTYASILLYCWILVFNNKNFKN